MSGVAYTKNTDGTDRSVLAAGRNFSDLAFAGDVTAGTSDRHLNWDASANALVAGNTATVEAGDTPSYSMLVQAKAYARSNFIRGIKGKGNQEYYHVFMTPEGIAKLKLDADFIANLRNAGPRGASNPLYTGALVTVDGLVIHDFRHVYHADDWGVGANV